jgi:hypothetical protein
MTSSSEPTPQSSHRDLTWTWQRGGTAKVVRVDGLQIEVHSSTPYPPGAPLIASNNTGTNFEIKVRSCRVLSTGEFSINGSLVNLTRDLRALLVQALAEAPEHGS